jgi:uncharacterized cupredoxin-like copper-binding protein
MKKREIRWFYVLVFVLLAVTSACSASGSLGDRAQAGSEGNAASNTVTVVTEDFSLLLDAQAGPGETTFVVKNEGSMPHDFAIRGNGVDEKTPMIAPGESAELTVELEPGMYTYVCTLPGHEQLGMSGTFTVTSN